jgi:PIN domain nuclease of toxin-antitoxin system
VGHRLTGVLLDTHVLLWWLEDRSRLSALARPTLEDERNSAFISAASAWEISIKQRSGKLDVVLLLADFEHILEVLGFRELGITVGHALRAGALDFAHNDPFDRMLVAQAQIESLAW